MILAIAAIALSPIGLRKPEPVILISWHPGYIPPSSSELQTDTLDTAVWATGRIIWRDPAPIWAERKGTWSLQPAKYYEGVIPPTEVAAAMSRLKEKSKGVIKNWGASIPDSHATRMELRSGKWKFSMSSTGEPPEAPPYGWEKVWDAGLTLWKSTRSEIKALLPKQRKLIPRPKDSIWQ